MLIDSHCHIDDPRFDADREPMLQRARDVGIGHFVTIGCDLETSRAAVTLAQRHPFISATVGVHPHEVKYIKDGWYDELRALAKSKGVVAYGEIGLDYHYDHSPREAQEDTITILKDEKAGEVGGVFHCFSGDAWLAKDTLDLGFYLAFSGVITFQNATMLRDIVKTVPLDRTLVETDSPYLTPAPHRGKRNEPAYVRHVAEKIAEMHGISVKEVEQATTQNTMRLFRISG